MNYTIIGDPHLKPENLEKAATLFAIAEEIGNPVIVLGDTLDTKELIRGRCLNLLYRSIKKSKLNWIFLIGNHCWFNLQCEEHSLEALKELPNVTIVDHPMMIKLGSWQALFLPYYDEVSSFELALNQFPQAEVLFMHQGVTGFDYGNGRIAEEEHGVISEKSIKRFKKVISGHFHAYQERGNLLFLGTPFSHTYGESNQQKYIATLNTTTLKVELTETPFPRHVTIEIDCDAKSCDVTLGAVMNYTSRCDYIRAILTGKQDNINKFDQSKWPGVKFIERPNIVENDEVFVSEEDSNEVKFQKWAEEIKKLDSDTIQLGLEILRSVVK